MNDEFEIEFIFKYQDWSDKVKKDICSIIHV